MVQFINEQKSLTELKIDFRGSPANIDLSQHNHLKFFSYPIDYSDFARLYIPEDNIISLIEMFGFAQILPPCLDTLELHFYFDYQKSEDTI